MQFNKNYRLDKPYEFVGLWWQPDNPERKVVGVLKYDPTGSAELELEGIFGGKSNDVLFGFASGLKISIFETYPKKIYALQEFTGESSYDDGYYPTSHICNKILLNVHFESLDEICLDRVSLNYGKTKIWTKHTGLSSKHIDEPKFKYEYTYERPEDIQFYSDSDIEIYLFNSINLPGASNLEEATIIREENFFSFENVSKYEGLFFFEHMNALRHFMSIASQYIYNPRQIRLTLNDGVNAHLLFVINPIEHFHKKSEPDITSFLFDVCNIENSVSHYYKQWYEFYCSCGDVSHLYLKRKSILHENFLAIAQALEHYYELQHQRDYPDKEYRGKMARLYDIYGARLPLVIDREQFSQLMANNRNYYSHFLVKKKQYSLRGTHLVSLASIANYLLGICLLTQFGFSVQEAIKRFDSEFFKIKEFIKLPVAE